MFYTPQNIAILLTILLPTASLPLAIYQIVTGTVRTVDVLLFAGFSIISLMGVSVGLHRLFSHRAFVAKQPVKIFLALAGSMTWQGNLFNWAAEHRIHHAFSDQGGDFHSPFMRQDGTPIHGKLKQFLHSHVLWFFHRVNKTKYNVVRDLMQDEVLNFIDRHYKTWSLLSVALPGAMAFIYEHSLNSFLQGALWGGLVRIFLFHHVTWCINSVTHLFGKAAYATGDSSHNLTWYAILGFGEGYHNNHHAFPRSAHFGFDPGQIFDFGWYTILLLEKMGAVSDVVYAPSLAERKSKRLEEALVTVENDI